MDGNEDVRRLLGNMKTSAKQAQAPLSHGNEKAGKCPGAEVNLSSYKVNQAWPGRAYVLVGNSYNPERRIQSVRQSRKRAACIALMLEHGKNNRNCLSVEDALQMEGFRECLSRFEFDWLRREASSTLLGPAYNERGELLPQCFAVWRREEATPPVVEESPTPAKQYR